MGKVEYGIGDFSILCKLTVKTIRFYQEEGLLAPSRVDPQSGYRYFSDEALDRARLIRTLRDWDFGIAEIREALARVETDEELRPFLAAKLGDLEARRRELGRKATLIKTAMEAMEDKDMKADFDIAIKDLPAFPAATRRVRGSYGDYGRLLGELFGKFGRWAGGKPLCLIHDSEYREGDADFEAVLPLRERATREGCREIPACRALCLLHQGPYDSLGASYRKLLAYASETGLRIARPTRELYLRGPGALLKGNPAKYLTEIQFPLEEA